MGLRIACYIAQRISSAIMYLYERKGYSGLNYLDDLASAARWSVAWEAFQSLYKLLEDLQIWESTHKRCPPDVIMTFLGISMDSVRMLLSLTADRLSEIKSELQQWSGRSSATKKELQHLIGKLSFAATTVRSGRLFFSRIITFMVKTPKHGIRTFDADVRKDINWWVRFIDDYNGVSIIPEPCWREPDSVIATDACLKGIGGFNFAGEYFHATVPETVTSQGDVHINELECLAIVVALKVWGPQCAGMNLLLYCDNSTTVDVINAGKASNRFTQSCLREIVYLAGLNSFQIRVEHVPNEDNRIPDALSRWDNDVKYRDNFFAEVYKQCSISAVKQVLISNNLFRFTHDW